MVDADGTGTCVHPHMSRPLYHCAVEATIVFALTMCGKGIKTGVCLLGHLFISYHVESLFRIGTEFSWFWSLLSA